MSLTPRKGPYERSAAGQPHPRTARPRVASAARQGRRGRVQPAQARPRARRRPDRDLPALREQGRPDPGHRGRDDRGRSRRCPAIGVLDRDAAPHRTVRAPVLPGTPRRRLAHDLPDHAGTSGDARGRHDHRRAAPGGLRRQGSRGGLPGVRRLHAVLVRRRGVVPRARRGGAAQGQGRLDPRLPDRRPRGVPGHLARPRGAARRQGRGHLGDRPVPGARRHRRARTATVRVRGARDRRGSGPGLTGAGTGRRRSRSACRGWRAAESR